MCLFPFCKGDWDRKHAGANHELNDIAPVKLDLIRKELPFFTWEDREKILGLNAVRLWGFRT